MKVSAKILAAAMKHASSIVQSTTVIPILANARLTASGGALEIVTSDTDIEYIQRIATDDHGELSVAVDAKKLAAIANAVPGDAIITMAVKDDGRLNVSSGRSRWILPILPASDFPIMPPITDGHSLTIDGDALAKLLSRVSWAISNEPTRHYLNGAYWHSHDGNLCAAATNGSVACVVGTGIAMPADAPAVIIPTRMTGILATIADSHGGEITVTWDDRKLSAVIGDIVLTSKLIDGQFPDYRRIIPETGVPVSIDPESALDAIKRIRITINQTNQARIIRGDGVVTLVARADGGESSEDIAAECSVGDPTGVNIQYLAAALTSIGGDAVEIHQENPQSPMLIRRVVDDGSLAVVMPMRIN